MKIKIFGAFLILLAIVIFASVAYRNSKKSEQPVIFSPPFMLQALWGVYKNVYWDATTGRTIDKQSNNITTSEGQSYTMLRAVWENDKPTFDKTWSWTQANLQHTNDHLFAWLYGTRSDGTTGILTDQNGQNSAADADSDIALALLFASSRWQDPSYAAAAKNIISDIWADEVVAVNNVPYLVADNLEKNSSTTVLIDPSYLAPYSYRIFAQVDSAHDWNALVQSSYSIIQQSMAYPLDKTTSANIPPDWVALDRQTGQLEAPNSSNASTTTDFGYDALRVPFRLALDYAWNHDSQDLQLLDDMGFLGQQWQANQKLDVTYGHDGSVVSDLEAPAMYGGTIGYFIDADSSQAANVYKNKLETLFSPDTESWKQAMSYYDDNWAWFGMALYNNQLPNLYQPTPSISPSSSPTSFLNED